MRIHEYQAKRLLAEYGVAVPRGRVATTPDEAAAIAAEIGGKVVIKAQVHAGGRGKAGGIKLADTPSQAREVATAMLGMRLVTHQTGPEGVVVRSVLVEEAMPIARELYLAVVLDRERAMPAVMASEAGGMDIEEVAAKTPEKILKTWVDPTIGFRPFQGRDLAFGMHLAPEYVKPASALIGSLVGLFEAKDCSLAEINPLVITADGRVLALDAKVNFDDNALFRHPDIVAMRDTAEEDPLEVEASKYGINFIHLDGNIGCMVNGAGLAMATMDIIKLAGGSPANFLDVGGGARADQVEQAFRLILSDPKVKAVLINIFGGITRCDVVAAGIVEASRRVKLSVPLVVRLVGTNVEEGRQILRESGLPIITAETLDEAAKKAVAAAQGGGR